MSDENKAGAASTPHIAPEDQVWLKWMRMGIVATDMEAYSLYCNAAWLSGKALAMFAVSDLRLKGLHMDATQRERSLDSMIEVALDTVLRTA